MKELITYEWKGINYTSACELNRAYDKGLINRIETPLNQFRTKYRFEYLSGVEIVTFDKDVNCGFSSQPTQFKLPKDIVN